jgi:hypothetical protein
MVWCARNDCWSQVCSLQAFRVTLLFDFVTRAQILGVSSLSKGATTVYSGQHAYVIHTELHAFMDKPSVTS